MEQVSLDAFVLDALMPDLIGHDRRPASLVVYLHLYRRAAKSGWAVRASHQAIADATGLSRSAVQSALAHLHRRQLVHTARANPTAVPNHRVLRPWQRLSRANAS
jgi:CRP-like cAMP-binding protein